MSYGRPSLVGRKTAQGFASILAVIFIVTAVFFALSQTLAVSTRSGPDVTQQLESLRALYLAESAQEFAKSALAYESARLGVAPAAICSNLKTEGSSNDSLKAFGDLGVTLKPLGVSSDEASCSLQATACVGLGCSPPLGKFFARRSVATGTSFSLEGGLAERATTYSLTLANAYETPGLALFNIAYQKQEGGGTGGAGGNVSAVCETGCLGGALAGFWNLDASSGQKSLGGQGLAASVPSLETKTVTLKLQVNSGTPIRSGVITGLVVPSVVPVPFGSLPPKVLLGTFANASDTVSTVSNDNVVGRELTDGYREGWCQTENHSVTGADLLVFMLGGRSETNAERTTRATIDTAAVTDGRGPQAIRMGEWPDIQQDRATNPKPKVCLIGENDIALECRRPFEYLTHYPRLDECTPTSVSPCAVDPDTGVVTGGYDNKTFSEVYYTYNSYIRATVTKSTVEETPSALKLELSCPNCESRQTDGKVVRDGTFLKVIEEVEALGGTKPPAGRLKPRTRVIASTFNNDSKILEVTLAAFNEDGTRCTGVGCSAPVVPLATGAIVCGGVCALFREGPVTTVKVQGQDVLVYPRTAYTVQRNVAGSWVAGFACARAGDIDPIEDINFVVGSAKLEGSGWAEIVSE